MGLKDWLWNDNASELFRPRGSEPLQGSEQAKNSPSFISTLLFGDEESRGMWKAIGSALAKSSSSTTADSEEWQIIPDGYHHDGPEGAGEYMGGMRVPMYDND